MRRHVGFYMGTLMFVITLAMMILSAGDINAATGIKHAAGLKQEGSIGDIPLQGRYALSAAIGSDKAVFHITRAGADCEAVNPDQSLAARFSSAGVGVSMGGHTLGLTIRGYGYGEALNQVTPGKREVENNRMEYHRGVLTEWYVNGPFGLQQGFTLESAPAGHRNTEPLTLSLDLSSDLRAAVGPDRRGLVLSDNNGTAVMRYSGLTAIDANGREAPSWMELRGDRLFLKVDDTNACYPLMIDPFIEGAKLTASDGEETEYFGRSVSVSGDTIVVGANYGDNESTEGTGAAYVFEKGEGDWADMTQTAKLTADDGAEGDYFGYSVSISGDTIVVGALYCDIEAVGDRQGSAYVFEKGSAWADMTQTAKLTADDGAEGDYFGYSVSISGDTIVVAAIGYNGQQGSAYVFEKGAAWVDGSGNQVAKLTASDGVEGDRFGSVFISGDTIVVGADSDDLGQGSAYVFEKGTGWVDMTQNAKLTASDGEEDDFFGQSVSISDDTIVAGAWGDDDFKGSAYVFVEPVGGWAGALNETAKLTALDREEDDQFGASVSISDDTIVIGAGMDDDNGSNSGSAYVFEKGSGGWADMNETTKLTASDGVGDDYLGYSTSISVDIIVIGAWGDDDNGSNSGSAYVFEAEDDEDDNSGCFLSSF